MPILSKKSIRVLEQHCAARWNEGERPPEGSMQRIRCHCPAKSDRIVPLHAAFSVGPHRELVFFGCAACGNMIPGKYGIVRTKAEVL